MTNIVLTDALDNQSIYDLYHNDNLLVVELLSRNNGTLVFGGSDGYTYSLTGNFSNLNPTLWTIEGMRLAQNGTTLITLSDASFNFSELGDDLTYREFQELLHAGDDVITSRSPSTFTQSWYGGAGDDTFDLTLGSNRVDGGNGIDRLILQADYADAQFLPHPYLPRVSISSEPSGPYSSYTMWIGSGNYNILDVEILEFNDLTMSVQQAGHEAAVLVGNNISGIEADVLFGSDSHDNIDGRSGNDLLMGEWGDDTLAGGSGDDDVFGGSGDDLVLAGTGSDTAFGDDGRDVLRGAGGNDSLHGGEDDDVLYGSRGHDQLYGDSGDDALRGGNNRDRLFGGTGEDTLYGGNQNDVLRGNGNNDTLHGGNGRDRLFGGNGRDELLGGNHNDRLYGGKGRDTLTGGAGEDSFVFNNDSGFDVITDFEVGSDLLVFGAGISSVDDLSISEAGGDIEINYNSNTVVLVDVDLTELLASDSFLF